MTNHSSPFGKVEPPSTQPPLLLFIFFLSRPLHFSEQQQPTNNLLLLNFLLNVCVFFSFPSVYRLLFFLVR
ncbi:unnamed protein product [Citrullus colocynthis]|uniref:Uncharacterized protein n=1 Tax=Citrullus colocynthis TaxID=252529 RepID=A0ABP0YCB2_9ROSI